jgi:hypothetical protein
MPLICCGGVGGGPSPRQAETWCKGLEALAIALYRQEQEVAGL